MKKLVLLLAVAFSVSMFSCGNGDEKGKNDTTDTTKKEAPAVKEEAPAVPEVKEEAPATEGEAPAAEAAEAAAPAAPAAK